MPVVTVKYNLPDEQDEYESAMNAGKNSLLLWEVEQNVFRPARKHGYDDRTINKLIEKLNNLVENHTDEEWPTDEYGKLNATDLIGLLEKLYYEYKNGDM